MKEEKNFKLEEIKEIRLNCDFEDIILPKNVIRNFSCVYNKEMSKFLREIGYLEEAYLEIDLDFILNEFAYFDFKKSDRKNIDLLKFNSLWYIIVTTMDDKIYDLTPPFYMKELYLDENMNIHNAINVFEEHKRTNESYIIHWKEDKEKMRLTMNEMIELFKNKKKKGGPYLKDCIQIAALDILLEEEKDRLDFFSIFCELVYDYIHHVKSEYKILTEYQEEKGFSNIALHLDDGENHGLIQFTFVKDTNCFQDILGLLNFNLSNKTFGKTILVLEDNQNLLGEEIAKLGNVIVINLDKLNQIWFQLLHDRGVDRL